MMHLSIITLLPEMFNCLEYGVIGRAITEGLVKINTVNPRQWAKNAYSQVDDKPYGGGPGMVMMYEPLHEAVLQAKSQMPGHSKTVFLSPQGRLLKQSDINLIARQQQNLIFIAGRYEGIDERIIEQHVDEEWSVGDFVLSGGELAAMVFMDAVIRQIPGSLGHINSAEQDSFMNGLLDYPHYTRPALINDLAVPSVLLGGNHQDIERWRRKQSLGKTWLKRPELLNELELTELDKALLIEFKDEQK